MSENLQKPPAIGVTQHLFFAGDNVRLAGQIDYPASPADVRGFPLIFIIQHATSTTRHNYDHLARMGAESGFAVFRWDKRGTGQSGAGGGGSATEDTLSAYTTAIEQNGIDRQRVVIIAQNEGSILLADAFPQFNAIQKPHGVLLLGNMLDEKRVTEINSRLHIIISKNDWNDWQTYAEAASKNHANTYNLNTTFYVAPNSNRHLMYVNGGTFHQGAADNIREWLKTCLSLTSN